MAFNLATVTAFISTLSMSGIVVKDYGTIQDDFDARQFPILAPDLYQPVTIQRVQRDSFGSGTTARQTILYTIPYVLACYDQGEGRGVRDIAPGVATAISTVATALIKNDTPGDLNVDMVLQNATINVIVNDPRGTGYHGARLVVLVKEYVDGVP